MGSADVIDLSSDEEEQPRPSNMHTDFQNFKFLLLLASIWGDLENPPGIFSRNGTGTAFSVKKEMEELSTSSSLIGQAGSTSLQNLSQMRPICRQFWKSGDYEIKKSAAAASQSEFSFFCFIASFNSFRHLYPHLVIQINNYGRERKNIGFILGGYCNTDMYCHESRTYGNILLHKSFLMPHVNFFVVNLTQHNVFDLIVFCFCS
jgi:hypothetical protein